MASSYVSSSSSSVEIIRVRGPDATTDDDAAAAFSRPLVERFASSLRTQGAVDALCKKHGVPNGFAARPAGDRRACTPPPPGAICLYAHSLQAGMRVPLHAFFCEVLCHHGLAPGQLAPNGWRVMVGFLVLCHHAGVRPSLVVFQHFYLPMFRPKGWYCFRGKDAAGALFTGLPKVNKGWKGGFFFLSSPAPWPCPVLWGEPPSKSSTFQPVLTSEEKKSVAKLLSAHGAAVDLRTYLCETNLAAAFSSNLTGASSPPPPSPRTTGANGMDPSVYKRMQSMRAEMAAAPAAAAEKVKTELDSDAPPLSGKKRKHEGANAKEGLCRSEPSTLPAAHGCSVSGASSPQPGFSAQKTPKSNEDRKPRHLPDSHDGDATEWEAARKLLEGIVTPSREGVFATAKPSDVVASSYAAMLQAANYLSFSLGYALELEEKLTALENDAAAEAGALREELAKAKTELAGAKAVAAATDAELENAKEAAVREFVASEEHVNRLAEHALEGYECGMEDMRRVVLRLYPHVDAARLVVPPPGGRAW